MNPPVTRPVDPLALLADARHPDPFSVLGPHPSAGGIVVRAMLPGAERVDGYLVQLLTRCHPERSEGDHIEHGPLHFVQGDTLCHPRSTAKH